MLSNLLSQLKEQKALDRLDEVLQEVPRVLNPGGHYVFSVPLFGDKTLVRVDTTTKEDLYLLPPQYHRDPLREEGALAYNDFGRAALAIDLQSIRPPTPGFEASLAALLQRAGKMAEQLTTDLQRLAHQLHPSLLEHAGLEAAVQELVEEYEARAGLKTEVVVRNLPAALSLDRATCLYGVVQESLQNVRKHANATHVFVQLLGTTRGVGLCIHDDGRGFNLAQETLGGPKVLGLISLEERVGALHGTFRVKSERGEGTEVHAWVPLEPQKVSEEVRAGV